MRSYPIWNKVTACIYGSNKSFGAKDTSETTVLFGSSSSNSHEHVNIITTKREKHDEKYGDIIVFSTSVDGVILKQTIFKNNNGKAGELIKQNTKLNRIKSL